MKLRSIIHRNLRARMHRYYKYHPFTEWVRQRLNSSGRVPLPEIDSDIHLGDQDVVMDIGANVGEITSRFASSGAEIYAFEPDPYAFAVLSKRFGWIRNVHCINKGVMDQKEVKRLYFCRPDSKDRIQASIGSSFNQEKNVSDEDAYIDIECIDINDFLRNLGKPVSLIKMDIEGAEVTVVSSMIESGAIDSVNQLVVETHEEQIESLAKDMEMLRALIASTGNAKKINLDWV